MATPPFSLRSIPQWFNIVEWLDLLQGPKNPPFVSNASFQNQARRFWRVLFTTGVLTGFSILVDLSHASHDFAFSPTSRYCVTGIAATAIAYCLGVSKLFGIDISVRQAFFTFGFLVLPWVPIFSLILFLGARLAFGFILVCYLLPLYILWSVARGISIVTGASRMRALISLSIFVIIVGGFAIYAFLWT